MVSVTSFCCLCNIFSLLVLVYTKKVSESASSSLFFDLNTDPLEATNIAITTSAYSARYQNLLTRTNYWKNFVLNGVVPDVTNKKSAWKKANGVAPWVVNNTFTAINVVQKYSYKNAPNIVFVLVDDWVSKL